MTALTVNGSAGAATTLVAAGKMFPTTGGTSGSTTTKISSVATFRQIKAIGTTTATTTASIPAPTDSNFAGWIWDVTTLEGQRLAAGTWTPTIHLTASTAVTVTPTVEWFKRSSGGVYTQIGTVTGSSTGSFTASTLLTFTPPSLALMDFATGDKLCMWLWVQQTAGGATNSTIGITEAISGSSAGTTGEAQAVTPGYAPIPVALSVTIPGVGTLTPTLSANVPLTTTIAGVGTLSGGATTYASDTFTRADNASSWGTASDGVTTYSDTASLSSIFSIVSNEGHLTNITSTFFDHILAGTGTATDTDVTFRGRVTNNTNGIGVALRCDATGANSYRVQVRTTNLTIGKRVASGTYTSVATATVTALTVGSYYWFRGQIIGNTLQAKFWADGSGEPDWMLSYTDASSPFTSGQYGFYIYENGTGSTWDVDHLTVTNGASGSVVFTLATTLATTAAGVGTLSGTLSTTGGVALSVTIAGVGTFTPAAFTEKTVLSSTLAGIGTLAPTLTASFALPSTTIAGVGTLTMAAPSLSTALTKTIAGVGTLTPAAFTEKTALTSTIVGIGTLTVGNRYGTAIYGTAIYGGAFTLKTALTDTLIGVGTLTGTLSTSGGVSLSVTIAGVGTLSGTFSLATTLTSTINGIGQLTPTLALKTALSVAISGVGTLTQYLPRVSRVGSQLFLKGVAYRFSGVDVFWLGLKETTPVSYPTHSEIDDALLTVVEMGGTVVRSHTLGVSTGTTSSIQPFGVTYPTAAPFNDAAFEPIDYAIKRAGDLGLKLIIPFTDDYAYYHGGKHNFTDYRGVAESTFYTDANVLSDFEAYISHVLNHINQYNGYALKDDPTIMAWETGNELSTATVAWTDTIAQYVKSIAPSVLMQCGKTIHACVSDGTTAMLSLASIDILTSHFYPPSDANETTWISYAVTAGRPQFVGEYDWTDTAGDTLASFLSLMEGNTQVAGDNAWSLFAHKADYGFIVHPGDTYAIYYPGQTTAANNALIKLRNHAFTMSGISIPADSTPLAPTGVAVASNAIVWHGVVGANTYDVERSTTSSTGPFSVIGTGLTDFSTPWTDTAPGSSNWYRVRAYNIDGVAGAYSAVVSSGNVVLSVTLSGVGTLTGATSVRTALSQTLAGAGTLTPTISLATRLSTTITGIGTLTGTLSTSNTASLAVTMAGIGTFTASAPTFKTALSVTCAGAGTVTPGLVSNVSLAATTLVGIGTLTGTIARTVVLSVSLNGTGTLSGTWSVRTALFATCAAFGTLSGVVSLFNSLAQPGIANVLDSLYGTASISDALGGQVVTTYVIRPLGGTLILRENALPGQVGISIIDVSPGQVTIADQG